MEAEKTQLLISIEHQRVVEKNAETERKKAVSFGEFAGNKKTRSDVLNFAGD